MTGIASAAGAANAATANARAENLMIRHLRQNLISRSFLRSCSSPARRGERAFSSRSARDFEHDLAELLPGFQLLVRGAGLGEWVDTVDDRVRAAARDQLVGAFEVLFGAHRRSVDGQLLPPDPVQRRR